MEEAVTYVEYTLNMSMNFWSASGVAILKGLGSGEHYTMFI